MKKTTTPIKSLKVRAQAASLFLILPSLLLLNPLTVNASATSCGVAFDEAQTQGPLIHAAIDLTQTGLPLASLHAETERFKDDSKEKASLDSLANAATSGRNPRAAEGLKQYLALSNSGEGGLSLYPAELEQILGTWPEAQQDTFLASLKHANELRATGVKKQTALETALREKGLLERYRANKTIISMGILDNVNVTGEDKASLDSFADINGVPRGSIKSVLSAVYLKVSLKAEDPLAKSDEMATLVQPLLAHLSSLSENDRTSVQYAAGTCVERLEEFQHDEFVERPFILTQNPNYPIKNFKDYAVWVKSFVEGTAPYATGTQGGLLAINDIRDIMSHNEWPVGMRPHDTRHIHYAVGHPRGVALVLESARSKNNLRARLQAALYESVDTVQYDYESTLSRYFRSKGMNMEQGFLYVASATQAQLNEVLAVANQSGSFTGHANQTRDWTPSTGGAFDGLGVTGTGFEAETDAFIHNMTVLRQDPANSSWMNYSHTTTSGQGSVEVDDPNKH